MTLILKKRRAGNRAQQDCKSKSPGHANRLWVFGWQHTRWKFPAAALKCFLSCQSPPPHPPTPTNLTHLPPHPLSPLSASNCFIQVATIWVDMNHVSYFFQSFCCRQIVCKASEAFHFIPCGRAVGLSQCHILIVLWCTVYIRALLLSSL